MARFAVRVLLYTIGASLIWWLTSGATTAATIWAAKALHRLVGAPAPYLLLEIFDYFWLAPPVQLFVGLTLASSWTSWRRRVQCLVLGVALLWFLVVMSVVVMSSPYLGPVQARTIIGIVLTKSHLLLTPVLFWLILTGPPPAGFWQSPVARRQVASRREPRGRGDARTQDKPKWWRSALLAVLICATVPVSLTIIEHSAPVEVRDARRALMQALRSGDLRRGRSAAGLLGKVQESHYRTEVANGGYEVKQDPRIYYLVGRLSQAMGDRPGAKKFLLHASIPPHARAVLSRELQSTRPPPPR